MKKKILAVGLLAALPLTSFAETPSFDFVQGGYANWDIDGISGSFDGFQVSANKSLNKNFYFNGDYQSVSKGSLDSKFSTVGLGYRYKLSNSAVFFGELDWANLNVDVNLGSFSAGANDSGYQAAAGFRGMVSPKFELKGAVEYLDLGSDDSTSYVVGAAYNFNKAASLYSDVKFDKDSTRYTVGVRYNF